MILSLLGAIAKYFLAGPQPIPFYDIFMIFSEEKTHVFCDVSSTGGHDISGDQGMFCLFTMHYAEVMEIRILKCSTLTNYFSVVFHPGCPKFCAELCELPKNIEKGKKRKIRRGKRGKKCKKHEGGVC